MILRQSKKKLCMFQAIVGQRAGKTRFTLSLLDHYSDIKRIYVTGQRVNLIDAHVPGAKKYAISSERVLELLNSENRHEAFNNTIVFVEECEHTENYSKILRLAATHGISVIGVSSRGPYSANIETSQLQHRVITIRAASWDWNTGTPWDSYLDHFAMDFNRAARDFGLYDAHTEGLVSVIKHRVKQLKEECDDFA